MTLYRKFGQFLAVLVCLAMFVMCAVFVITKGVSTVDAEKGDVIYFFEHGDFQGYLFVALAFLISAITNWCATELPQIASVVSVLPLAISFYEMAVGNLFAIVAAVILLLAMIHLACNVLAWIDLRAAKVRAEAATTTTEKEATKE